MIQADELRNAAIRILQSSRTPLHFERIADRAMTQKIILTGANMLDDYMGAVLRHDVGQYGSRSAFVETAPGHYGLNPGWESAPADAEMEKSMPKTSEFEKAAIRILRGSIGPLHFGHIASRAISEGIIQPTSHTVAALMGEVLHNDILQNGTKSPFVATDKGFYRLSPNHSFANMPSIKRPPKKLANPQRHARLRETAKFNIY